MAEISQQIKDWTHGNIGRDYVKRIRKQEWEKAERREADAKNSGDVTS